jgi:hypothetical protein
MLKDSRSCASTTTANALPASVSSADTSPESAYDLGFFDEFARAAGWTERASLENPELRQPS